MRIVSLLPGTTEIVGRLGMADRLVGVSHECPGRDRLPSVTRSRIPTDLDAAETDAFVRDLLRRGEPLFELDESLLANLRPNLVLSQALCNACAIDGGQIARAVRGLSVPPRLVEYSPTTLDEVIDGMAEIADAIAAPAEGRRLVSAVREELVAVRERAGPPSDRPSVVFLEWLNPLFCSGHWIPELVEIAGGVERIGRPGGRSTAISPDDLLAVNPDVIVVACCGWSADRSRAELASVGDRPWWRGLKAVRAGRVCVMDAEYAFTMPGPGLAADCRRLAAALQSFDTASCG